jgi:uncharacterized protein YndB with AHSA1/START domain
MRGSNSCDKTTCEAPDPDEEDHMTSVDVQVETVIHRPREVVAAYATDPSNAPEWYANIKSVEWRTSPPVRVGSRMDFVAKFMGKRIAYTYEVAELVSDQRLVMRASDAPMAMETTYTWSDVGDGTRMTLRNRGGPRGFAKITAPIMAAATRRATTKDLARLKEILEGTPAADEGERP